MVAAGATLAGAQGAPAGTRGFINGPVTIFGAVQPGTTATSTSAGQINFNGPSQTVTFNAGSKYTWDLAALTDATNQAGIGYDQIGSQNGPGLNLTNGVVELAFNGTTTPTANSFWQSPHQWTI